MKGKEERGIKVMRVVRDSCMDAARERMIMGGETREEEMRRDEGWVKNRRAISVKQRKEGEIKKAKLRMKNR